MSKLTKILSPDGSEIYIQYDEEENDELRGVGFINDIAERTNKFKAAIQSTIAGYSQTILSSIKKDLIGDNTPSKVTLEFGLQAGGETGVIFVTKGTADANVKVTVEWDFKQEIQTSNSKQISDE